MTPANDRTIYKHKKDDSNVFKIIAILVVLLLIAGGAIQFSIWMQGKLTERVEASTQETFDKTNDLLEDGNYELRVVAAGVSTGGANSYPMFEDYLFGTEDGSVSATDSFFRFFGDTDGDRDVDGQDLGRFGSSFLQDATSPSFDDQLDYAGDGDVDGQDYSQLGRRFLKTLET